MKGVIRAIDSRERTMTIQRDAIAKWGRGPATLEFRLAPHLTVVDLAIGQQILFHFEIRQGVFLVTDIYHDGGAS